MDTNNANAFYVRLAHSRRTKVLSSIQRLQSRLDQLQLELDELDRVIATENKTPKK